MGGSFRSEAGASLTVWGDTLLADKFEATILAQLNKDEADGWKVTYRRITPRWASYSGIKDGEIRYFRAIAICENRFAVFQLDYSQEDKVVYDPIVERMVDSLKVEGC
jgi:hypothetical protein